MHPDTRRADAAARATQRHVQQQRQMDAVATEADAVVATAAAVLAGTAGSGSVVEALDHAERLRRRLHMLADRERALADARRTLGSLR
jgi:hypothetical protein